MPGRAGSAKLHLWSARLLERAGRQQAAAAAYERAIRRDGRHAGWHLRLGALREARGDLTAAAAAYEAALSLDEAAAGPHRSLARCLDRLHGRDPSGDGWDAIADAYRRAVSGGDVAPVYHGWLGVALQRAGDWTGAAASFEIAASRTDEATWQARLGQTRRKLEDWPGSLDAYRSAVAREPQRASHHHGLAVAAQHLREWQTAVDALRAATTLDGTHPDWFARLGVAFEHLEDWEGAAAALRAATEGDRGEPGWFARLGRVLERLEDWEGAAAAFERSIALDPGLADVHHRLGTVYERLGPPEVTVDSRIGLRLAPGGRWAEAERCHRAAAELDPRRPRHWLRLGAARERLGDLDGAAAAYERVTELAPDLPAGWFRRSRVVERAANRRGGYRPEDLAELERLLGKVLELAPDHLVARQHLIRALIRAERWSEASKAGWYPVPSDGRGPLDALRSFLEGSGADPEGIEDALSLPPEALRAVPHEWWFPLHWRLLTGGWVQLAYRAKGVMAHQLATDPGGITKDPLTAHLERARGLAHLGRIEDAVVHLDEARNRTRADDDAVLALAKLAADLRFAAGDVEQHRALRDVHRGTSPAGAEERFKELIEGRRVAVVGPAESRQAHGDEIDRFDVVIRTKFAPITAASEAGARYAGTRTDLSYYALASVGLLRDGIDEALARGDLQMAVFRPPAHALRADRTERAEVRYMPSEYRGHLRANQFAIQRILYDVLRYAPAAVKVFNINFFVSSTEYRAGYVLEPEELRSRGLVQPLAAFGHDFLADFAFTQRLVRAGLVDADPDVRSLLDLSPDGYLAALDAKRRGPGPHAR